MSDKDKNSDLTFPNYLGKQLWGIATVVAGMAAGWAVGRKASFLSGYKGPNFEFVRKFNIHFLERRLASHRTEDGIIPLSYIGAITGGALGGFYQGFKGWRNTVEHERHVTELLESNQMEDAMEERLLKTMERKAPHNKVESASIAHDQAVEAETQDIARS